MGAGVVVGAIGAVVVVGAIVSVSVSVGTTKHVGATFGVMHALSADVNIGAVTAILICG